MIDNDNQFFGSDIEKLVYDWLTQHGIRFRFQSSLSGGYYSLGGMVVDFILTERNTAIRVMGEYYHQGVEPEGKAIIQREQLEAMGYIVVDCWGEDILSNIDEVMSKAILGIEMLRGV